MVDVYRLDTGVNTRKSVLVAHCVSLGEPVLIVSAKKQTNRLIWKGEPIIDDSRCPVVKEYLEGNVTPHSMSGVSFLVSLDVYANTIPSPNRQRISEPAIEVSPVAVDDGEECKCHRGHDTEGEMVRCEECDTWQHILCHYESVDKIPALHCCSSACQDKYLEEKKTARKQKFLGDAQKTNPVHIKEEDGEEEYVFNRATPLEFSLIHQSVPTTSSLNKENRDHHQSTPATNTNRSNTYLPSPIPSV